MSNQIFLYFVKWKKNFVMTLWILISCAHTKSNEGREERFSKLCVFQIGLQFYAFIKSENRLSPWRTVFLHKLIGPYASNEIRKLLSHLKVFTVFSTASHWSLPPITIIKSTRKKSIYWRSILKSSNNFLGLRSYSFPSGFPTKILYAFLLTPMRLTFSAHLTPFVSHLRYDDSTMGIKLPLFRVLSSFTITKRFAQSRTADKYQSLEISTVVHPLFSSIRVVSFT
jgi:hypothetical protein